MATKTDSDSDTQTLVREEVSKDAPWHVIVHDDPVNVMAYVTWVLQKVFGYDEKRAKRLMLEVHQAGRSIVWSGIRERAEFHVAQLQAHQLTTSLEKSE